MDMSDSSKVIQSREEFVLFVQSLSKDFRDNNSTWENNSLGSYLDALAAWTNDLDGYYNNRGELAPVDVNWNFIAELLIAAKYYE